MKWTHLPPSEPGWYWVLDAGESSRPYVVHVSRRYHSKYLHVGRVGSDEAPTLYEWGVECSCYWSGPLDAPTQLESVVLAEGGDR